MNKILEKLKGLKVVEVDDFDGVNIKINKVEWDRFLKSLEGSDE